MNNLLNIHPLFVHFPVALLLVSIVLFFVGGFIKRDEIVIAAKCNLILGSLAAIAAVITGLIAAKTIPHNQEIHQAMGTHEKFMIAVLVASLSLTRYILKKKEVYPIKKTNLHSL